MTEPVVVIGAGASGLTVAAELGKRGIPAEIIDRSDMIGSPWRNRYDRLRLNTCRWYSTLSKDPFPKGTPVFPDRDGFVRYLQAYARRHELDVRLGVEVHRIERHEPDGWLLDTSDGKRTARRVVISTGLMHTPRLPAWFSRDLCGGRALHSSEYRNADGLGGRDVLVVGGGSSGLDIALDLADGGARRVRLAVRSAPYLETRMVGPVPSDLLGEALFRLPTGLADRVSRLIRRFWVGDLSRWGLPIPEEDFYSYVSRTGGGPVVVGRDVIRAVRRGRIEIVPAVEAAGRGASGQTTVRLRDGTSLEPDAIIAATGFTTGLEPVVGHLGVLRPDGLPVAWGGPEAAPGLRFSGYIANINNMYNEGRRVAEEISRAG